MLHLNHVSTAYLPATTLFNRPLFIKLRIKIQTRYCALIPIYLACRQLFRQLGKYHCVKNAYKLQDLGTQFALYDI
jgi:hypothetical protein